MTSMHMRTNSSHMVAERDMLLPQERLPERTCEQVVNVHVRQAVVQGLEVPEISSQYREVHGTVEQILDVPVPEKVEQLVEVPETVSRDGVQQQTMEQIVDAPVMQAVEELAESFKVFSQDRIQQRAVEQTIPAIPLAEKIVELPVIQTEGTTQQVANTHVQHVVNAVEVENSEIIEETGQKPIIQEKINPMTKHVEIPELQFLDKVEEIPVVAQRQIPIVVQTVQKTIEIPQLQCIDDVIDVPVVLVTQVPQVQVVTRTVEISQLDVVECVKVHPAGLVKPDDPDAQVKFLAAETLHENRFDKELRRRDCVMGEMWKNKPPLRLALNRAASDEIARHCKHCTERGDMKLHRSGTALAEGTRVPVSKMEELTAAHCQASLKTVKNRDREPYPAYPSGKSWCEACGKMGSGQKFYHNVTPGSDFAAEAQQQHKSSKHQPTKQAMQQRERKEEKGLGEREKGRKDEVGGDQEGRRKEKERKPEVKKDVTGWTVVTRNRRQGKMVQIFVRVNGSKAIPMDVNLTDDKVEDVIRRIQNDEDVYVTMHGRVLRRDEKLKSCEVTDGCTIQVTSRLRGGGKHKDKKSKADTKRNVEESGKKDQLVGSMSDKCQEMTKDQKDALIQTIESNEGYRKLITTISEAENWEHEIQCFRKQLQEQSGIEEERAKVMEWGMRWAVEARRRGRSAEQEQRRQEEERQRRHQEQGENTGRGNAGLVRGGDERCQTDETSKGGNGGKGEHDGKAGGAGSKGRQQVENLVMDEIQENMRAKTSEENHEEDMRKLLEMVEREEMELEMMQQEEMEHEEQRGRVAPNMGAGGSHPQATSDTGKKKVLRWADCNDEEVEENEEEVEEEKETGQWEKTEERPPGLEEVESKQEAKKEQEAERKQEQEQEQERRAQEAREEERRAQEAREEQKRAQEAREELKRAQEAREEERRSAGGAGTRSRKERRRR